MIATALFLLAAPLASAGELPPLPGMSGMFPVVPVVASTPTAAAPVVAPVVVSTAPLLMPPKTPERPKGTLDTAAEVARDLAVRVEYFENGQSYYRAYTKGSHNPEENKAFLKFLEDYDAEVGIAKRTHAILGTWLDRKSSVKD